MMFAFEHLTGDGQNRNCRGDDMNEQKFVVRTHEDGDIEWVVQRHAEIYRDEYGWGPKFVELVEEIANDFVRDYDARRERLWIAEKDRVRIGCIMLVRHSDEIGQLRLLLVDPAARGLGVGQKLVDTCVNFARESGYTKVRLWTNDILVAARRLYEAAGFVLIEEEPHSSWGVPLVSQTWELSF